MRFAYLCREPVGQRSRTALAVVLATVLLAACASDQGDTPAAGQDTRSPTSASVPVSPTSEAETPEAEAESESPTDAVETAAAERQPFATVQGTVDEAGGSWEATLDIFPLQRTGEQLILTATLHAPEGDSGLYHFRSCTFVTGECDSIDEETAAGLTLVDTVNGNRHLVLREGGDGPCLCSKIPGNVDPGGSVVLSGTFPPPPEDVETMTVEVPGFPPVAEVPIQ